MMSAKRLLVIVLVLVLAVATVGCERSYAPIDESQSTAIPPAAEEEATTVSVYEISEGMAKFTDVVKEPQLQDFPVLIDDQPGFWNPGEEVPDTVAEDCSTQSSIVEHDGIFYNCATLVVTGMIADPQQCEYDDPIVGRQYRLYGGFLTSGEADNALSDYEDHLFSVDPNTGELTMAFENGAIGTFGLGFGNLWFFDMTPYTEDGDEGSFVFDPDMTRCEETDFE
jgi:hypothetical protein